MSSTKSLDFAIVSASATPPEELLELELLDDEALLLDDDELLLELLDPVSPEDELELLEELLELELELDELEDDELLELDELLPPSTGGHSSPGHQLRPTLTECVKYAAILLATS